MIVLPTLQVWHYSRVCGTCWSWPWNPHGIPMARTQMSSNRWTRKQRNKPGGRHRSVGQWVLIASSVIKHGNQWIGLRENLQESPIFNGKIYGFRFRFSLKPIHWGKFLQEVDIIAGTVIHKWWNVQQASAGHVWLPEGIVRERYLWNSSISCILQKPNLDLRWTMAVNIG